ncbi:MAG: hypothetical protein KAS75_01090 [Planctomycetes bacterium]|nr:hypothetical protein [Planctomycetota bacterium]
MPGISCICDFNGNLKADNASINRALDSLVHTPQYQSKTLLAENSYFLGYTAYDEYPVYTFENETYFICLEGRIYENDDLDVRLNSLAEKIFRRDDSSKDDIAHWLLNTDGDFIIVILHKRENEIVIINDVFARLPLYYFVQDERIIVSREIKFIESILGGIRYDQMGIAQFLLFGYTTGIRTLFDDISYLLPGTLIRVNFNTEKIEVDNVSEFNFEEMANESDTSEENINELTDSFRLACQNRCSSYANNILALSGGLDSRAVAACLADKKADVISVTRLSANKKELLDVEIAKEVAGQLKLKWELVSPACPRGSELLMLLKMKSGMNSLEMGFTVPFLEKVKDAYGPGTIYFTGDGGDRIKPHVKSLTTLNDTTDLVDYIIAQNQLFTLDEVSALTGIPAGEISEEIKNTVLSYPETDLEQKYVHFMIYESAFKWVFEGEDRNRYYFWSVTPFYSVHFFNNAMRCSENSKAYYDLYRKFLLMLAPEASTIDNADWKLPITSRKLKPYLLLKSVCSTLPETIKTAIKTLIKGKKLIKHNPNFIRCLQEQTSNHLAASDYFSSSELKQIIKNVDKYKMSIVYNLFTIASIMEYFDTGKSSLEKYCNTDFI